ncbi:MAG: ROK family glucokinase [Lachnospiraceae bacterium]|nr:ROK family glucokinase [Lachnospiraceae bacterium]
MAEYVVGVDIGGTTVKLGLFTVSGELLDKWEITTRKDEGGKYILGDVAESVLDKLTDKNIDKKDVAGVGMGVPGPVKEDGTVLKCANLGWGVFNVEDELEKLVGLPVKAGNDANMAALGEMWQGGGKGYSNQVMVTLGTGVGGGIILNGKMLSGVNGAGGEIGHMQINDDETEVCGCGKTGCLEQYTSATGIVRAANKVLDSSDKPSKLRSLQYVSAKEIFDAAKEGDELASDLVEEHGRCLGKALAQIACVVDPEIFVIGGGVSRAGQVLIDTTSKYFQKYAFHACRGTKFALATLGNDAGIYGAANAILGK